ncbi:MULTISPECIES: hypothetical protein [Sulfitobacter]|uniref:Phage tail protein n=1 Tax=Sulfitobacter profundi TaxID=2679961 RepID=A0ABW1YUB5_9RHOB|nr:hypothetical protein [Sulfitobacter indolifex]
MNQHYIVIDQDGLVVSAGVGIPPVGAIIVDRAEVRDLRRLYVDGANGLVPRPAVPGATLEGDSLSVPSGPAGTRLRVVDRVSDEILWQHVTEAAGAAHVLTLADPGAYVVDIDPPSPWIGVQMEFAK